MRRLIVAARRTQLTRGTAAALRSTRRHKSTDHFDAAATEKKIGELQRTVRDHLARQDIGEAVAAAEELGGEVRAQLARGVEDHVFLGARGRAGHTSVVQTFEATRVQAPRAAVGQWTRFNQK